MYIPFYKYDGTHIKKSKEKIKVDTEIVKHFGARNYLSIYLPDYGVLTINTADEILLKIQNDKFVNESDLTQRLDILIKMVETETLSSLGQLRGKAGGELLRQKEKHLRETSAELIKNEKKFRNLYENAPIAYFSIDCDGTIQRSNRRAQELLGYDKSELLGKNADSLLSNKGELSRVLYQTNKSFSKKNLSKNNNVTNIELQLKRKDQTHIWFNFSIDTIKNGSGDILEYRVAAYDITDRKQAEAKIEKANEELEFRVEQRTAELQKEIQDRIMAEEKYRRLMEASPVPITVYDMKGNAVYINPAFSQTFGWSLEELQGEKIDYVPEEEIPATRKMLELVKQGEGHHGFETRRYSKNKKILDVSISFDVWRGHGGILKGSVVILHDVTERKRLEAQLLQSHKMEAIGTLAGGIAQDFNNILSGIFSFSQLAERNIENSQKVKAHISQIVKGAQRAAELVQQILTFSRQTGTQKRLLCLSSVVTDALKLLRSSIPAIIEIRENITSEAMVMADSTQMHQVIMNLCTNAYHAMSEKGGILTIGLKEIEVSEKEKFRDLCLMPGRYLKLEVKDTGHGMSEKTLEKAFDLYFTTKKVGKGTGFGLALVHSIAKGHDGFVRLDSVLGQGSTFYVYLPVAEKKNDTDTIEIRDDSSLRGTENIMIVDDEESIRTGTKEFLEDCGYQVSAFENGLQAFEEFNKDPRGFDLIITDMNMPQMTGEELSVRVLKTRKEMPIILCTGYSEIISEARAIELGIQKYVQKPILSQELSFFIRETLDRKTKQTN